jgi:hypothetical protein
VGHAHDLPFEAQGEEQLGGVRNEADDAHLLTVR